MKKYIIKIVDVSNQDAREYTIVRHGKDFSEVLDPEKGWIDLKPNQLTRPTFTMLGPGALDTLDVLRLVWQPVEHQL